MEMNENGDEAVTPGEFVLARHRNRTSDRGIDLLSTMIRRIERSSVAETVMDRTQRIVTMVFDHRIPVEMFSGRAIGHPMHPLSVQIPSGMWIGAMAVDALGGRSGRPFARMLIGLGVLTSAPAVASGLTEWMHTRQAERRVGAVHALCNVGAIIGMGASWNVRRRNSGGGRPSAIAAMALLSVGGWLGGHLAYSRGVGVNTAAFLPIPTTWTGALDYGDLRPGEISCGHADGVAVAVMTAPDGVGVEVGTVLAMESRCTHRGGPLHEGAIEGGCISCPWHGSRFDVVTGGVIRGPASIGQLVYRTRLVGDRIEVIADDPGGLRTAVI